MHTDKQKQTTSHRVKGGHATGHQAAAARLHFKDIQYTRWIQAADKGNFAQHTHNQEEF